MAGVMALFMVLSLAPVYAGGEKTVQCAIVEYSGYSYSIEGITSAGRCRSLLNAAGNVWVPAQQTHEVHTRVKGADVYETMTFALAGDAHGKRVLFI